MITIYLHNFWRLSISIDFYDKNQNHVHPNQTKTYHSSKCYRLWFERPSDWNSLHFICKDTFKISVYSHFHIERFLRNRLVFVCVFFCQSVGHFFVIILLCCMFANSWLKCKIVVFSCRKKSFSVGLCPKRVGHSVSLPGICVK